MDYLQKRIVAGEIARVAQVIGGVKTLAEKLDVQRSTISRWLNSKSMPSEDFVQKLIDLGGRHEILVTVAR